MVKNLPELQETRVQSLGWEDLLEKGMATQSSILAWRISRTESGGLQPIGSQRVKYNWATNTFTYTFKVFLGRTRTALNLVRIFSTSETEPFWVSCLIQGFCPLVCRNTNYSWPWVNCESFSTFFIPVVLSLVLCWFLKHRCWSILW